MLSYSLYIHPTERRLTPFSLSMSPRLATKLQIGLIVQYAKTVHDSRPPYPSPGMIYATYDFYLLIKYCIDIAIFCEYRIDIVSNSKNQYRYITTANAWFCRGGGVDPSFPLPLLGQGPDLTQSISGPHKCSYGMRLNPSSGWSILRVCDRHDRSHYEEMWMNRHNCFHWDQFCLTKIKCHLLSVHFWQIFVQNHILSLSVATGLSYLFNFWRWRTFVRSLMFWKQLCLYFRTADSEKGLSEYLLHYAVSLLRCWCWVAGQNPPKSTLRKYFC